jgi:catechol 2,3-dioxygenase-like lactoylglutathione lyase family enzyme
MTKVSGLYRIGLGVPNIDTVAEFYTKNWAMELVGVDGGRVYFRSRGMRHGDLMLRSAERSCLDHIALYVDSEPDLQSILERIQGAGHSFLQGPTAGVHPGESISAAVRDPDVNRIEIVVPEKEATGSDPTTAAARHLGHVVLWSPQVQAQEDFYALLGFQVSDRTHVGMSFLRCNTDHHSIALARSARGKTGLQHVAFDVGSIDEVMREFGRLRSEDIDCVWGVGRHGPGNNVFSYYTDPAGNVIEYYGEMEKVAPNEKVTPKFWDSQHRGDLWGVAGAPPEIMRD